jgi:hypothetical protein
MPGPRLRVRVSRVLFAEWQRFAMQPDHLQHVATQIRWLTEASDQHTRRGYDVVEFAKAGAAASIGLEIAPTAVRHLG